MKKNGLLQTFLYDFLKIRGSIHIKKYMTGQEKGDCLIGVIAWAGLIV
jgi:hypothetical protein